jgi:hypothetical protein
MKNILRKIIKKFNVYLDYEKKEKIIEIFSYSRYNELINRFIKKSPVRVIEIGVWKGDRSVEFLTKCDLIQEYVGFDLFEDMNGETHQKEGMALCFAQSIDTVSSRLQSHARTSTKIHLIPGNTFKTLPEFIESQKGSFDFIYLDGGHSLETIDNDWKYASRLLDEDGICIFDDYYLEDNSVGCKKLIDSLDRRKWSVDFFRGIELTVENHYITMVEVRKNKTFIDKCA